jgi:phosphoserine aminotransferase
MHKPSPSRKDPFPQYLPTISVDLIKTAWQPKIGGDPIVVYVVRPNAPQEIQQPLSSPLAAR